MMNSMFMKNLLACMKYPPLKASNLVFVIKDTLLQMNLTLAKAHGECYDGASNMCGIRSGVAKQIQDEEPRALFTHCYGHSLSLPASNAIKKCKDHEECLGNNTQNHKTSEVFTTKGNLFHDIKGKIVPGTLVFVYFVQLGGLLGQIQCKALYKITLSSSCFGIRQLISFTILRPLLILQVQHVTCSL